MRPLAFETAFLCEVVQSKRWTGRSVSPDGSRCSFGSVLLLSFGEHICPAVGDPIHRALRGGTQQASLLRWAGGFGLILTSGFKSGKLFN